ncbi:MAG TPA: glycosyltransferase family 2 protein [Tepidiformaceae bacterium]|nr:glycosyltransferase family 2 protein [Tepidiformaceae bacterium]
MRTIGRATALMIAAVQFVFLAVSLYQSAITLLGRRGAAPVFRPALDSPLRFALVVCARNEASVIGGLVTGLVTQEYPRERIEVIVVAHNCDDATATVAARAGARVVELTTEASGKALAMAAGLEAVGEHIDYVGIFDADSRVPATLVATVAAACPGSDCVQVETVPHETADWLATGYGFGRRARNLFWWRPREVLGLGTTMSGSGYFIRPPLLRQLLAQAHTLTEDLELTARLYAGGGRVRYVSSTYVQVEEAHSLAASVKQRLRWARGHITVIHDAWPSLLRQSARGDLRAFDIAIYLVMPTRVLTRTAVTGSLAWALIRAPGALPLFPVLLGFAGEWVLPSVIALRERLVPANMRGVNLAMRHSVLNLLWFPIGLWGLISARAVAWDPVPRTGSPENEGSLAQRN